MGLRAKAVLRRLTHSQYNNTVRDLLKDTSNPANQFPPEDYVNGFKNQYEALSLSPILAEAYSRAAERLAAKLPQGRFARPDPLQACFREQTPPAGHKFIQTFGRRAFRRPSGPGRDCLAPYDFQAQKRFSTARKP